MEKIQLIPVSSIFMNTICPLLPRRIKKSPTKDRDFQQRFSISLIYPTAYKTVKDTTNFIWIQKEIPKGHMNLVAYSIPLSGLRGNIKKRIPEIRDSIGKNYIPGRLKGSYMITEKAYRPYYYYNKNLALFHQFQ